MGNAMEAYFYEYFYKIFIKIFSIESMGKYS